MSVDLFGGKSINDRFDAEYLRSILRYDPDTGLWRWKVQLALRAKVGSLASPNTGQIAIHRKAYSKSILAYLYTTGEWRQSQITHENATPEKSYSSNGDSDVPNDMPGRFGISFNRLRELIECDPEKGWAKRKFDSWSGHYNTFLKAKAGDLLPANSQASIDGHHITLHHVIWVFHTNGKWAPNDIDHKDGNRSNNKISNLREATRAQNNWNRRMLDSNTTGITGVRRRNHQGWIVEIRGKYLGHFADFDEACQARWDAEDEHYGEFARRHSRPRPPMKDLFST